MWRRHNRRLQQEDATDKHASLDFGLGENGRSGNQGPEMTQQEKIQNGNRSRGMSLEDMMEGPFVLPVGERGSVQSLSRLSDTHDPYRPVQFLKSTSQLSLSRPPTYNSRPASGKSASIWTSASGSTAHSLKSSLLANAQNPSRTDLILSASGSSSRSASNSPPNPSPIEIPETAFIPPRLPLGPTINPPPRQRLVREGSDAKGAFVPRETVQSTPNPANLPAASVAVEPARPTNVPAVVAAAIAQMSPTTQQQQQQQQQQQVQPPNVQTLSSAQPQRIIQSIERPQQERRQHGQTAAGPPQQSRTRIANDRIPSSPTEQSNDTETYADVLGIVQKESRSPPLDRMHHPKPMPTVPEGGPVQSGLGLKGVRYDTRSSPPAEVQQQPETAELRANRVRSFYKEYFDSSPVQNQHRHQYHARKSSSYSQDYNQEHFYGAPIYDPATGEFYMAGAPYAQPINRRAMTPPPRAPPRSFRNSPGPRSASSTGRPRGNSSSSNRVHGTSNTSTGRGRTTSRSQPPAPLTVLPTPAQMKDDSAIFSPTDFAPPISVKSRAAGGMSPSGGARVAYQGPGRRAFSPLASSFDDLAFMPSP